MAERTQKVLGEGGAHLHKLESPVKTQEDGFHKHLFFVNDRLVMTDLSGAHTHPVDSKANAAGASAPHKHNVPINTQEGLLMFETDEGTPHSHELQSATTTLSGLHTHMVQLGDEVYLSLLPGDLIAAVEQAAKSEPSLKNFKVKKDDNPLEMNFGLVKRLNAEDFKPVMKRAVVDAVCKAMSRLIDGLQVESLVLSRSRFFDVGAATRFVLDAGLGINGAAETDTEYVFNIRAKDKFDETSLQRIRLTDGVEAVVGLLKDETKTEDGGDKAQAGLPELTDRNKEGEAVATKTKQVPAADASTEDKRAAQKKRAREFGIEAIEGGNESLTPPAGSPSDLSKWGDPVNFKFPLDTDGRIANAVARYGQGIGEYKQEASKKRVAERIAAACKKAGVAISADTEIWNYLSQKTRDQFKQKAEESTSVDSLKSRFGSFMSSVMDDAPSTEPVTKRDAGKPKKKGELVNWKTDKPISGTGAAQVAEIAKTLGLERKYVTVESAQKRFIEYLVSKYEVKNAVYENTATKNDEQTERFLSFEIHADHLDAVLHTDSLHSWRKSLVIFFDDPEKLDEIFKTEIKNHEFGAYEYRQTMMGPVLYPVVVKSDMPAILDDELLNALDSDTKRFFSPEVEAFFGGANPIKKVLPYKRGVLMYGPPGNGKTTFIKHYITEQKNGYAVLCDSLHFDADMGKFLDQSFGKEAKKVIVFEDVDAIASRYEMRSSFLNFLDGAVGLHKTLIIMTTNYPDMLDSALTKRPSRIDQKYYIGLPNEKMRTKFLRFFFPDLSDIEMSQHVKATANFSGAFFKELFILKGMRQCTVGKAIELVLAQMQDVRKSAGVTLEAFQWALDDDLDVSQLLDMQKVSKAYSEISLSAPDEDESDEEGEDEDDDEEETEEQAEDDDAADEEETEDDDASEEGEGEDEDSEEGEGDEADAQKVSLFFNIAKADTEKRLVIGPVLVPENFDLQDDIISADEIEKASHNYMIKLNFRDDEDFLKSLGLNAKSKRGFMHVEFNRKIALVESYTAPVDFKLGERDIKAGTWIMAVKVFDDEVWSLVKANRITGFSIGGRSRSIPAEA